MKKIITSILAVASLNIFAQMNTQEIPWNVPKTTLSGHVSSSLTFNKATKKLKYQGGSWKSIESLLFMKDGGMAFATGQYWTGNWPTGTFDANNEISVEDFSKNFGRLFISNSGNTSIGTEKAGARLHVDGTWHGSKGLLLSQLNQNRGVSYMTNFSWSGQDNSVSRKGDFGIIYSDDLSGKTNTNAGFIIAPNRSGKDFKGFRMDAKGNVGIGTNLLSNKYNGLNDYFKLSVNGSIRAKEIVVETGWADFVFEDDYNLMSLEKVEDFIEENNHLPGLPSAKTISENGLEVGAVQTIQMQKIEELTLYAIEQQKLIQTLLTELKSIKSDVATLKN